MADMTREEAARVLETEHYLLCSNDSERKLQEAILVALSALRSGWVKTAERPPTEADAGYNEEVVALYRHEETEVVGCDYWKFVAKNPGYFPYWMPLPKLPEVEV